MARSSTKRKTNLFGFKKRVTFHGKIVRSGSGQTSAKKGLSSVQQDVVDALVGMKMSKDQATRKVLAAKDGSFDDVFRSVMKRNPTKAERKCNPTIGEKWEYAYRAKKGGKWKTLHATGTIKSVSGNTIKFTDGRAIDQSAGAELIRRKNPGDTTVPVFTGVTSSGTRVVVYPSTRKAGSFTVFVGGVSRVSKKTERGAVGYAKRIIKANPAKLDRCVKKVSKSAKKRGKKVNAYAVCKAAGTKKNPHILHAGLSKSEAETKARKIRSDEAKLKRMGGGNYSAVRVVQTFERPSGTKEYGVEVTPNSKANPKAVWTSKQGTASARVLRSGLPGFRKYKVQILRGSGVIQERDANNLGGAISIARLLLHQRATNPAADLIPGGSTLMQTADKTGGEWGKVAKRFKKALTGKRSKNPVDKAVKMYEEFHGLPASEMIDVESKEHIHSVKVGVGYLVCLDVITVDGKTEVPLTAEGFSFHPGNHLPRKLREKKDYWEFDTKTPLNKVVLCTMNEAGNQLFLDGGNQEIPFAPFGLSQKDERDHMLVGTIVEITYRTKKSFEANGKVPVDFHHEFGKEGSGDICPVLLYFPRSKQLKIAGGRYQIAAPEKSLGYVSPGIIG